MLVQPTNAKLISKLSVKSIIFLFATVEIISFTLYFSGFYPQSNLPNILSSGVITGLLIIFFLKANETLDKIDESTVFFLLTFVCWFIAESLYGYFSGLLRIDAYPSVADAFYLVGYLFLILFLGQMNKLYKIELGYVISTLVTVSLFVFYVLYVSIFIFEIYTFSGNLLDLTLLFIYPIFDLFIIVGAVMYYFRGKAISINKGHYFWIFVAAAGVFFFIADLIFGYNDLFNFLENVNLFDLFYDIGYSLFGVAFIIKVKYTIEENRGNKRVNTKTLKWIAVSNLARSRIKGFKAIKRYMFKWCLCLKIPYSVDPINWIIVTISWFTFQ